MIILAVHTLGIDEWPLSSAMSLNVGARRVVRTVHGNSDNSDVKVGMHQCLALSLLLFAVVNLWK